MRVIHARNVHDALPKGLRLLHALGDQRDSRNGPVIEIPGVSTVYSNPIERVIFWPERDANPFFHLYESLWMLLGRNEVAPLEKYVKKSIEYSDDGTTLHGAYGFRWRQWFTIDTKTESQWDQLEIIADRLKKDPTDRRCVLQMWDCTNDLDRVGKDVPCNTIATFQRDALGKLNLVVFCRSNDIVWGAYGANAVQFGALLEYMAHWIGCPMGTYTQVSVSYHGYLGTLKQVSPLADLPTSENPNPYDTRVVAIPMAADGDHERVDELICDIIADADADFTVGLMPNRDNHPWAHTMYLVLKAHHIYKTTEGAEKYKDSLKLLEDAVLNADWVVAAREWIGRREAKFNYTQLMGGELSHP